MNILKQIIKFVIVGSFAFIIDCMIFYLLNLLGLHYLISQIISFLVSFIFNYLLSIKWVFDAKENILFKFIVFSLIGLLLNEILLYIGIDILNKNTVITKVLSTIIVMIFNFITRKIIIEKPNKC